MNVGWSRSSRIFRQGHTDRIVIAAAKKYGCRAIGYEIDPELVALSRKNVRKAGVQDFVKIERKDIFTLDLSECSVITVFLYPRLLERLLPQLDKLKPGSRIVSHHFLIPGVKPNKTLELKSAEYDNTHSIHLWTTPLKKKSTPD